MAKSLRERQSEFASKVPMLINKALELGYEVTLGDAYRDPRLHGSYGTKSGYGASKSFHKLRLAIDLNLYKEGKYLDRTEDHQSLGEWWESVGGTWGGRFGNADGNHYSWGE
jgi:hypothetical protein